MNQKEIISIIKREPYIPLPEVIRSQDIVSAFLETHPDLENRMSVVAEINKAILIASIAHEGVLRKSGVPYINHPFSVAYFLAKMGLDKESVISGILHDTVEDSSTTVEEIKENFGDKISLIVDGVTKFNNIKWSRNEKQARAFQKLITFAADDIRVIFVKLVDRLHNMMTLDAMPDEKKKRIANETLKFYAPLAHRLGIYWLKEELESLSFYFSDKEAWQEIDEFINKKYKNVFDVLKTLENKVLESIKLNDESKKEDEEPVFNLIKKIKSRVKSYYSIYKKTLKKDVSINALNDIIGIRVILDSKSKLSCYKVMAAVHSFPEFTVINGRFKDYISKAKDNGYQSIHTAVRYKQYFIEIQIRTVEMDIVAEEGNASHWSYKNQASYKDKTVKWLKEVLKDYTDFNDPLHFMKDMETAIPLNKITAFTPTGEVKTLPENATLLDFAYTIHEDLGNTCIGGTVNGKKVPISFTLSNKNEVSIETSKNQFPRRDWLNFVKTSKARQKIRRFLNKKEKELFLEQGKSLILSFFKATNKKLDASEFEKSPEFLKIVDKYSLPGKNKLDQFFIKLTTGEIKLRFAIKTLFTEEEIETLSLVFPNKVGQLFKESKTKQKTIHEDIEPAKDSIFIQGIGEVKDYHIAKCCHPVHGDPVVVFMSQTRGYILHKKNCDTLLNVEKDRIVEAFWYTLNTYLIEFFIEIKNEKGAILSVVKEFDSFDLNISSLQVNSTTHKNDKGIMYIVIKGTDLRKLEEVEKTIKKSKFVLSCEIHSVKNY